jgi:hypothetical protein
MPFDLTDTHIAKPAFTYSDQGLARLQERFHPLPRIGTAGGGERLFGNALTAIEIVGVGGAMSYLNARHAPPGKNAYEVAGLPADVVLGLLFSGVSVFTGYFGKYAEHGLNVGIGFLLAYACRMGSIWGQAARGEPGGPGVRGYFGAGADSSSQPYQPQAQHQPAQYPWAA